MKPVLVWDWDGTLVDSLRYKYEEIWDEVFPGEPEKIARVKDFIKTPEGKSVNRYGIIRHALLRDGLQEAVQLSSEAFEEHPLTKTYVGRYSRASKWQAERDGLFHGVKDMLRRLYRGGYPMYVISGGGTNESLKSMAENLGIGKYFRGIFGFGNTDAPLTSFGKRENLNLVMKSEKDFEPSHYIVIGDGETDRRFAEEVTCGFVGIANEWNGWHADDIKVVYSTENVEKVLDVVF